jgi:preprotein translocase subunit SecD
VLIRALAVQAASGAIINSSPNSWFVLNDDAVLTGADLTNPQQGYSEATGPIPAPDVTFGFTSPGKRAFEELTAKIARRAREAQARRVPKQQALQHFAVVLDDQLIDVPAIDYTKYPEGLDAAYGSEIEAGFTVASGRSLASDLRTGPLPLRLVRLPRRNAI